MLAEDKNQFQCCHCFRMFKDHVFTVSRVWERVSYEDGGPALTVRAVKDLERFCSKECMNARIPNLMLEEGVPVNHPTAEPDEECARCKEPVEMSRFHLTYVHNEARLDGSSFKEVDYDYLSVVCQSCAPYRVGERQPLSVSDWR